MLIAPVSQLVGLMISVNFIRDSYEWEVQLRLLITLFPKKIIIEKSKANEMNSDADTHFVSSSLSVTLKTIEIKMIELDNLILKSLQFKTYVKEIGWDSAFLELSLKK